MTKEEMQQQIHDFAEMMYKVGYEDGQKSRKENDQDYKDGLEDGRMEAWECAKKIMQLPNDTQELFYLSAKEAITKIKEYEEAEAKEQVNQWDEICYNRDVRHKAVIVNINEKGNWNCLDKDNYMALIDTENQKYWHKTGKNYLECANVLEQLRGENNDN